MLRQPDLQRLLLVPGTQGAAGADRCLLGAGQWHRLRAWSPLPENLHDEDVVTFEDDRGAYSQADAEGFIRVNALRLVAKLGRDLKG